VLKYGTSNTMNEEESIGKRKCVGSMFTLKEHKRYLSEKMMDQLKGLSLVDSNLTNPREQKGSLMETTDDGRGYEVGCSKKDTNAFHAFLEEPIQITQEDSQSSCLNVPLRLHWNISEDLRRHLEVPPPILPSRSKE